MRRMTGFALLLASIAAPLAATAQPAAIDPAWLAGSWSDNPNCSERVQFMPDGRYVTSAGEARWRIERGNLLVLQNGARRQETQIERVSDRQIRTASGGNSYRCPNGPAPAAAFAASAAQVSGVTRAWLIGAWSDNRDCSVSFEFRPDGAFITANGPGTWSLERNRVTLTAGTNRPVLEIARIGQNEMRLISSGVPSYRCR